MLHMEGKRFGKLTVIERRSNYKWLCLCDCGTYCEVYGWNLTGNRSKSCGCHHGTKPKFDVPMVTDGDKGHTFAMIAYMYENTRIDWDVSTHKNFDNTTNYFNCLHNVFIEDLTEDIMRAIMDYYSQEKYSAETYRRIRYYFNGIFNFAVNIGAIEKNPLKNIKKPRKKKITNENFWTSEDFDKFLTTFDKSPNSHKLILIYSLGFYGGLRKCEVASLMLSDIDFMNKTLTIQRDYKFSAHCIGDPKTFNSYRTIGLCDRLYTFLLQYLDSHPEIVEQNGLLFGDIPSASYIRFNLINHQKGLGLPYITFHRFRHSHVVMLLSACDSVDMGYMYAVANHVGADYKTILKVYMHASYNEKSIIDNINKNTTFDTIK